MGLQMKVTFFSVVVLMTLLQKANADNELRSCNVGRSGKPPLNASACDELENGSFLITPCSHDIDPCIATKDEISFHGGCADSTPSTTTPQQVLQKAIEKFALNKKNTRIVTKLSDIDFEKNGPDRIFLAKYNQELNKVEIESKLLSLTNSKNIKHIQDLTFANSVKSGWIGIEFENSKFVTFNVSKIIPKCDTSPNSQSQRPTSKKDGE